MRCTRRCRGRRCSPEAVERSMWYKVGCTAGDNVLGEHTRGNTWSIAYILSPTLLTVRTLYTQSRFRTYCNLYRLTAFPARQGKARPISVKPQAHTHTVQAASYALKDRLEERVALPCLALPCLALPQVITNLSSTREKVLGDRT